MKPRIVEFDDLTFGGWHWAVEYDDILTDARVQRHFRTNRDCEGLWENGRQTLGTGQFSLPEDRRKARAKVYRLFVRETDEYGMSLK